jgi:hypothetical protein
MQPELQALLERIATRDRASLMALHARHRDDPGVRMKRGLWARLLTTALGTQFSDDDELFVAHTLLVNSAEIIAQTLTDHGFTEAVEPSCFDWIIEVPGGKAFIRSLSRRLGRFPWATVEHDVLKILYESVIPPQTRKQLGEYYTPDWLAEKLVADTLDAPLEQRVLDPSCGSGTFVFHAVRRYLDAAIAAGQRPSEAIASVTQHVLGMDLHPVAVTLARVTYLLAIGHQRLASPDCGPIEVPIYLRDSMQWQQSLDVIAPVELEVDVLIGNPPWLAYRHMPKDLQKQFNEMSKARGLWRGAKLATQQDLSSLFVARSVQLYLRVGGRFAFVVPSAALDRQQYSSFRAGHFDDPTQVVHVAFERAWDLRRLRPHFFPRGVAVVFGRRAHASRAMPNDGEIWTGRIPEHVDSWTQLEPAIERVTSALTIDDDVKVSDYKQRFRNGATIFPRMLFFVERRNGKIRSIRSKLEKSPWRELPSLEGAVEAKFIMPVLLGEHLLPYRTTTPAAAVIGWDFGKKQLFEPDEPRLDAHEFLSKWWRQAAEVWNEHRSNENLSFVRQLDYHGKLSAQFPIAPIRVAYAASGMHLCAARIENRRAVMEHALYWCRVLTAWEAHYLCAILNAACVTELVRPHMSYGKDERHIDKHVWKLPIPLFDAKNRAHMKLAEQAAELEAAVEALELDDSLHFAARRRHVREFLASDPTAKKIEAAVAKLLGR